MKIDPTRTNQNSRMKGAGVSITTAAWLLGITENQLRHLIKTNRFPSGRSGGRIYIEPSVIREELATNPVYLGRRVPALLALARVEQGEITSPKRGDTSRVPPDLTKGRNIPLHLRANR